MKEDEKNKHNVVLSQDELRKMRKMSLIKLGAMGVFSAIIIIFGSVAWFTMSREVENGNMKMNANTVPYTIETRGQSGYYKEKFDKLNSDSMEWKISSEHNFDNHISAKLPEEKEPAIEPGDHGSLEFRVNPQNSDSITVDCLFEIKAYIEEAAVDGEGNPTTVITEVADSSLAGFLNSHILLFAGYDTETDKYTDLIDNNNENLEKMLEDQTYTKDDSTYTTIYWYWPEHLSDLTDSANTIYDPDEHEDIIAYIARNKDGFFKECSNSETKVRIDLTTLYDAFSNQIYNYYNLRYDNADLDIGNNINYVILSMKVK